MAGFVVSPPVVSVHLLFTGDVGVKMQSLSDICVFLGGQHVSSVLMTYSSSSGSSGSNEFIPGIKDIKDLRRSTSQTSLCSSFQSNVYANVWKVSHKV